MWKATSALFVKHSRKLKFPNISRLFNEEIFKKKISRSLTAYANVITLITVFIIVILLAISTIVGFNIYNNLKIRGQVLGERQKVLSDIAYWENVIAKSKNYRDGYFTLALLHYQLKDFQKAKENLDKSLELEPNFEKGRELEKFLISNF